MGLPVLPYNFNAMTVLFPDGCQPQVEQYPTTRSSVDGMKKMELSHLRKHRRYQNEMMCSVPAT